MKKTLIFIIAILCCTFITGCSKSKPSKVMDIAEDVAEYVSDKTSSYTKVKNVNVHTEDEMLEFALSYLEEKYGEEFVIDKSFYKYKHKNGHEDAPMVLNARVRPVSDDSLVAAFYLEEPNLIRDNYSAVSHLHEVEDVLFLEFEEHGLEGTIIIDASSLDEDLDEDVTAEDIIYNDKIDIKIYQPVNKDGEMEDNLPLIRKWLDYLYTCDYNWDFGLVAEDDSDYILFQINKFDHGYNSSAEWSDKELLDRAEFAELTTKKRKEKYDKSDE
ncbi:MAG: hypothetical protein K6F84_05310 [Lachnospiraceae bacterium]|nr:hypothetical protein [Lachnospiraceae bacterium]